MMYWVAISSIYIFEASSTSSIIMIRNKKNKANNLLTTMIMNKK